MPNAKGTSSQKYNTNHKHYQIHIDQTLKVRTKYPVLVSMYPKIHNRIGKVCALVAATLTLPVLAYADSGKGSKGDKDEHR